MAPHAPPGGSGRPGEAVAPLDSCAPAKPGRFSTIGDTMAFERSLLAG